MKIEKNYAIILNQDDWPTILALLDTGKARAEREDALMVQEIYTKIKEQIKEQIKSKND